MEFIPSDSSLHNTFLSIERNTPHLFMRELSSPTRHNEIEQNALLEDFGMHGLRNELSSAGVIQVEEGLATIFSLSLDGVSGSSSLLLRRVGGTVSAIVQPWLRV